MSIIPNPLSNTPVAPSTGETSDSGQRSSIFDTINEKVTAAVAETTKEVEKQQKEAKKKADENERRKLIDEGDRTEAFLRIKIGGTAKKPKEAKDEKESEAAEGEENEADKDAEGKDDEDTNPLAPESTDTSELEQTEGQEGKPKDNEESDEDNEGDEDSENSKEDEESGSPFSKLFSSASQGILGASAETVENKELQENIRASLKAAAEAEDDDPEKLPKELYFDSRAGDVIVAAGTPFVRLSTYMHSTAKFILYDPDDTLRPAIWKMKNVEIEIGYVNGYSVNKFVGVVYSVGRWLPNGCIIEAVDPSYEGQQGDATGLAQTTTDAAAAANKEEVVVEEFSTNVMLLEEPPAGSKLTSGKDYDKDQLFATHLDYEFGAKVRLTNPENNKTVTVTVEHRGATGSSIMELTPKAFEVLGGDPNEIPLAVKGELLGKKESEEEKEGEESVSADSAEDKADEEKPNESTATTTAGALSTASNETNRTSRRTSVTEQNAAASGLNFENNGNITVPRMAEAIVGASMKAVADREAAAQGNVVTTSGTTQKVTGPGQAKSSGVILDYAANPAAFIRHPTIVQRTNIALQNGYGGVRVVGADPLNKTTNEAIALTGASASVHPTGNLVIPDSFQSVKVGDPIISGGRYTWGDATKGGSRVPSKDILGNIVGIAKVIEELTDKFNGGKKFHINSWYRTPAANRNAGPNAASKSRHLTGDAIDFSGGGYNEAFRDLNASWEGGVGNGMPSFCHVDNRHLYTPRRRDRWNY